MRVPERPRELAHLISAEARGTELLLVPIGSLEQHGPHLPLDTDSTIATAVAHGVAERLTADGTATWVAPAIALGSSGEHQHFAGTVSIGTDVLRRVVVEAVRSARTWVPRVLLVNGHGGNRDALVAAVAQLVDEGHDVDWVACATESVDLHAGRTETSLLLHLQPDQVRLGLAAAGDCRPLAQILPELMSGGVVAVSANGVLGDPTGASAAEGASVLGAMIDEIIERMMAIAP